MADARITRINVTPVKSLRLDHPEEIELVADGAREDRRFLLVDADRRLYNGKRDLALVRTSASWDPGERRLALTLPGGVVVDGEVPSGKATLVEEYRRALRARDGGGWATDDRPASLVSRASLDTIDGDGRRFRMLFELDDLPAHTEDEWRNRRLRVGGATLLVGDPTPRCAVPTTNPDTREHDRD